MRRYALGRNAEDRPRDGSAGGSGRPDGAGPNSWELVFLSRGTDDVVTVEVRAEARKTYSLAATGAVAP